MKLIILVVIITLAQSVYIDPKADLDAKIQQIKESGSAGALVIDLAQISQDQEAPLQSLKKAITQMTEETANKLQALEDDYRQKQAEFASVSQNIEVEIGQANIDIAQSQDLVDNVLLSGKTSQERRLEEIQKNMKDNRSVIQRDRLRRSQDHDSYVDNVKTRSKGINGIDEALSLINGLITDSISLSEAPVQQSVQYVQKQLRGDKFGQLISSLMDLSGSLNDKNNLKQVRDLLNTLRNNVVDDINHDTETEHSNQDMFEDRQKQLETEYTEFQRQVNDAAYQLNTYGQRIQQEQQFQASRKSDLQSFQNSQDMEGSTMADYTSMYNEARQQLLKQVQTTERAKEFLSSAQFSNIPEPQQKIIM